MHQLLSDVQRGKSLDENLGRLQVERNSNPTPSSLGVSTPRLLRPPRAPLWCYICLLGLGHCSRPQTFPASPPAPA